MNAPLKNEIDFKQPLHSEDAEQALLGSLIIDNKAYDEISQIIKAEDFYNGNHRFIYEAIKSLIDENKPADAQTITDKLTATNKQNLMTVDVFYIFDLVDNTPSSSNAKSYADIVKKYSIRRSIVTLANRLTGLAYREEDRSKDELISQVEGEVFNFTETERKEDNKTIHVSQAAEECMEHIENIYYSEAGEHMGTQSGFTELDNITGGLQRGELIILAGRPSMGKTALALNIAEEVASQKKYIKKEKDKDGNIKEVEAIKEKQPVLFFSMEMGASQLTARLLSSLGQINQNNLKTGELSNGDWESLYKVTGGLKDMPIWINESAIQTPARIKSESRRMYRQLGNKLGLIVIDYLQLMYTDTHNRNSNRPMELAEISRALKGLAKELNVPVLVLSQLNRGVEQRGDKRPFISDLRDSGAIEQDADLILMIYRDEYYNHDSADKGIAEVIIGKNRTGATGTVQLVYEANKTKFKNKEQQIGWEY